MITLERNTKVGTYRIVRLLGRGGMGTVYKAVHETLGREVALKFLNPELLENPQILERFKTEAKVMAKIDHPYIVNVYDFFNYKGTWVLVMEYLEGQPLSELIKKNKLSWRRIAQIGKEISQALSVIHQNGIIHRDIKSSNIIITKDGKIKILDFGIVRTEEANYKTATGVVLGSPAYMAPELIKEGKVTPLIDIYACGVVLYEMVQKELPFSGKSFFELVLNITSNKYKPLRPDIPEELKNIIKKAMAFEPSKRYQSASELARDLEKYLKSTEKSTPAYRRKTNTKQVTAIFVLFLIAGITFYLLYPKLQQDILPPVPTIPSPIKSDPDTSLTSLNKDDTQLENIYTTPPPPPKDSENNSFTTSSSNLNTLHKEENVTSKTVKPNNTAISFQKENKNQISEKPHDSAKNKVVTDSTTNNLEIQIDIPKKADNSVESREIPSLKIEEPPLLVENQQDTKSSSAYKQQQVPSTEQQENIKATESTNDSEPVSTENTKKQNIQIPETSNTSKNTSKEEKLSSAPQEAPTKTQYNKIIRCRKGVEFHVDPEEALLIVNGKYIGTSDDWDNMGGGKLWSPGKGVYEVQIKHPKRNINFFLGVIISPNAPEKVCEFELELED